MLTFVPPHGRPSEEHSRYKVPERRNKEDEMASGPDVVLKRHNQESAFFLPEFTAADLKKKIKISPES